MARSSRIRDFRRIVKQIGIARLVATSIVALIGGWLALALAVSGVKRTEDPVIALQFVPGESMALATRASELLLANPQKPPKDVQSMALAALRDQAINPRALRVLGYYADTRGDRAAGSYMRLAERQSRREAPTQLWLIEDAVRKGDLKQALVHYDIALRTKPGTYDILFPILLAALEDPAIRTALAPYLHGDHSWARAFITYANANSENLPVLVDLVLESRRLGGSEIIHNQTLELLQRLAAAKLLADARRLYLGMPGATPARLTDARITATDRSGQFGPIGWQVVAASDSGGGFVENEDRRIALSLFANAATTTTVASRILYLPPGSYDFAARLAPVDGSNGGFIRWQMRCPALKGDEPIWRLDGTAANPKAVLQIPDGCPAQFLDIVLSGGNGQAGIETMMTDIAVRPRQ